MRSFRGLLFIALLTLQGILVVGAPEPLTEEPLAEDASPHSAEEVQEAREEFEGIDTNKDGFITKEEILEMDEVPEKEEIEEFFNTYDTNKDGRVTFDEILQSDDELRAADDEVDKEL